MQNLQAQSLANPLDNGLFVAAKEATFEYKRLLKLDLDIAYQVAKVDFIKKNDENTSYFHARIADRKRRNGIREVVDLNGVTRVTHDEIGEAFVSYFSGLFASASSPPMGSLVPGMFRRVGPCVNMADLMCLPSLVEIKRAVFDMGNNKSPGPDGYTPFFFKKAWDFVGADVVAAVFEFFCQGILPRGMNSTFITLVPKIDNPISVTDYRPISLCNVTYKIFTKFITNRLKLVLPFIISDEQAAFVLERKLHDNVFIAHDILKHYDWRSTTPRMCFKIDLSKAFDSVSWSFLREVLISLDIPMLLVERIMTCVTTPSYSVLVNGSPVGYFRGGRGLRQGDPLSPFLFVMCMEFLGRMLQERIPPHLLHPGCASTSLTHLFFADDLLIFTKGTYEAVDVVINCLEDFASMSGLKINRGKSEIVFGGLGAAIKRDVLQRCGFSEGVMPFRYLGLPLSSKTLSKQNCQPLLDKVVSKLFHWSTKKLSYAGRAQLINSVIFGITNFWCGVPFLPVSVLKRIDQLCMRFYWGCLDSKRSIFLSWKTMCYEKKNGGIGVKELLSWNKAMHLSWVHRLIHNHASLWGRWMYANHIMNASDIWVLGVRSTHCAGLKKILKTRDEFVARAVERVIAPETVLGSFCPQGRFKPSLAYNWMRDTMPLSPWRKFVWDSHVVPKHAHITFLALNDALPTLAKLNSRGFMFVQRCILCKSCGEDVDHLFLRCPYSNEVWHSCLAWLGIPRSPLAFDRELRQVSCGSSILTIRTRVIMAAAIYSIWKERNNRVFNNTELSVSSLVNFIVHMVEARMC